MGFAKISRLHFYSTHGISEDHGGTDKWLDMWKSVPDYFRRQQGAWYQMYRRLLLSEQTNLGDGAIETKFIWKLGNMTRSD